MSKKKAKKNAQRKGREKAAAEPESAAGRRQYAASPVWHGGYWIMPVRRRPRWLDPAYRWRIVVYRPDGSVDKTALCWYHRTLDSARCCIDAMTERTDG